MSDNRETGEWSIPVLSKDPIKEDEKPKHDESDDRKVNSNGSGKDGKKEKDEGELTDMSEEDQQLKAELELLVSRLREDDSRLMMPALEALRTFIKTSTSSMTSVPKPLKFLRPFYEELGKIRRAWHESMAEEKSLLASILSVLAMTYSDNGKRDTLYYRLISKSTEDAGDWGHEYVRHLAAEIGTEYSLLTEGPADSDIDKSEKAKEEETIEQQHGESRTFTAEILQKAAEDCVGFFLSHNAEADAVDLLMEVEKIEELPKWTDDETYARVCQYLVSCVPLLTPPDDEAFLQCAAHIYSKHDRYPEALALAVRLNNKDLVQKYYSAPTNPVMRKQLSYFLARSQIPLQWVHSNGDAPSETIVEEGSEPDTPPPVQPDDILAALGNQSLSKHFRNFGKAVGVFEPKSVEDVYKLHLEAGRSSSTAPTMNSYRENLATTYVNAFVNAGFGNDRLLVEAAEGESWIYKNKDTGMKAATASIGMSLLWDGENGIDQIDKYSYSSEEQIKAGALLATGILHAGIRGEPDLAWALLEDHVQSQSKSLKIAAMMGTAVSHANWRRDDIATVMLGHVAEETSIEIAAMAALTCGFTFVGSGDGEIANTILQAIMERDDEELDTEWAIFYSVALGLIFMGAQDYAETTIQTLQAIEHPMARSAELLVDACAWAGTGNVLKIQQMLQICSEHAVDFSAKKKETEEEVEEEVSEESEEVDPASASAPTPVGSAPTPVGTAPTPAAGNGMEIDQPPTASTPSATEATPAAATPAPAVDEEEERKKKESKQEKELKKQGIAVIGIALVAMGEEVGAEMVLRHFQHLMTYGEPQIRKCVPLALGLISSSKPQLPIIDALSKYSHDQDLEVALNAIFAMGLVGAGTNNARLAQMLRMLAVFYATEPDCLFVIRIAQGLVHIGKGTIGLNPFYHDGTIMSHGAMAGLLSVIVSFTDAKSFILKDNHWMLYWLVTAMYPQFLITLDENDEEQDVTVRVGQAVNTVGLAGTRSGISGFQTHQTPVRVATGDRAELGTNEFFPYQPVLEGLVVLKKNEGFSKEDH